MPCLMVAMTLAVWLVRSYPCKQRHTVATSDKRCQTAQSGAPCVRGATLHLLLSSAGSASLSRTRMLSKQLQDVCTAYVDAADQAISGMHSKPGACLRQKQTLLTSVWHTNQSVTVQM